MWWSYENYVGYAVLFEAIILFAWEGDDLRVGFSTVIIKLSGPMMEVIILMRSLYIHI